MKLFIKKMSIALIFVLTLSIILPYALPRSYSEKVVEAATVKISKKALSLLIGETFALRVTGTKETIKWKSSNKTVVTVSSKGKISAIKKGTSTITALVSKKKYICKVTVEEETPMVAYIGDRSVQYEKLDKCYILLFSLQDDNNIRIASEAAVAIKIVNDDGETIYNKTNDITNSNFGNWTSALYGERYLCSVYIPDSDITAGSSSKGTIHFSVSNQGNFAFDESKLSIDNLPYNSITNSCSILFPSVPVEVSDYSYSGKIDSIIKVEDIEYVFEESYDGKTVNLTINFTGVKTYDNDPNTSSYGHIGYKLYKDGYVVESGTNLTPQLSMGDKFKNSDESFYGLEPGVYTLELLDSK